MPKVGQAPDVIPIPELSEREKQDRIQDLEGIVNQHDTIRAKVSKLIPMLDEIIQDHVRLERSCETNPSLRAVYIFRRLGTALSLRTVAAAKHQLTQLVQTSAKTVRHAEAARLDILDPELPGVVRDIQEVREMLRKMAKREQD